MSLKPDHFDLTKINTMRSQWKYHCGTCLPMSGRRIHTHQTIYNLQVLIELVKWCLFWCRDRISSWRGNIILMTMMMQDYISRPLGNWELKNSQKIIIPKILNPLAKNCPESIGKAYRYHETIRRKKMKGRMNNELKKGIIDVEKERFCQLVFASTVRTFPSASKAQKQLTSKFSAQNEELGWQHFASKGKNWLCSPEEFDPLHFRLQDNWTARSFNTSLDVVVEEGGC